MSTPPGPRPIPPDDLSPGDFVTPTKIVPNALWPGDALEITAISLPYLSCTLYRCGERTRHVTIHTGLVPLNRVTAEYAHSLAPPDNTETTP